MCVLFCEPKLLTKSNVLELFELTPFPVQSAPSRTDFVSMTYVLSLLAPGMLS